MTDTFQSNMDSRSLLNGARIDMANALADMKASRDQCSALGVPEAGRAMSIAITQLETALLWADKANAELPPR